MLRKLAPSFRADCARSTAEIRAAIGQHDVHSVQRAAHTIKGMVIFFGATAATEAALKLETIGQDGDLVDAERTFAALQREIANIQAALAELCGEAEAEGKGPELRISNK